MCISVGTIPLNEECAPRVDRCEDPHADCSMSRDGATRCLCVDTHFEKSRSGYCSK